MIYIDIKYAQYAGVYIERFKILKHNPFTARGRCKICGDSKKSKTKARLYFFEIDGGIAVNCKNCGYGSPLSFYLKEQEPALYDQYKIETFADKMGVRPEDLEKNKEKIDDSLFVPSYKPEPINSLGIPKVIDLDDNHPVKKYVRDARKIPDYANVLYAEEFCKFASKYKDEFKGIKKDHSRIVIPFLNKSGEMIAFQARALGNEQPKYYTIFLNDKEREFYGVERINKDKNIYIVEGPIDSMFLPNGIAALSSNLRQCADKLSEQINKHLNGFILVYDNEPRNKEIVKLYDKSIELNYNVVLWPETFKYKDINAAIADGMPPKEVYKIIKNNTFRGLEARLRFAFWKKV